MNEKRCEKRVKTCLWASSHSVCSWCEPADDPGSNLVSGSAGRVRHAAPVSEQERERQTPFWKRCHHSANTGRSTHWVWVCSFSVPTWFMVLFSCTSHLVHKQSRAMVSVMSDNFVFLFFSYDVASLKGSNSSLVFSPVTAISYQQLSSITYLSLCIIIRRIWSMKRFTIYKAFLYFI